MGNLTQRSLLAGCAIALCPLFGSSAFAQADSSPTAAGEPVPGEIIVTARKTNELLRETPVAVTAVTAEQIKEAQINTVFDLQRIAPSLSLATGGPGGTGVLFLSIRGQTNGRAGSTSDPAIATYVDGVVIARPTAGNFALLDVAQTEVLRGPQGTLFGRNTTGGALNMRTVDPDGTLTGYVRGQYGNFDSKSLEGAVSVPIQGDELGFRIAGSYQEHDGYGVRAIQGGRAQALDYAWGARATLKWAPSELPITVTLRGDMTRFKDNGILSDVIAVNPKYKPLGPSGPSLADIFALRGLNPNDFVIPPNGNARFYATYGDTRSYNAPFEPLDEARMGGVSGTIDLKLGQVDLKSITAWRETKSENAGDLDGMPLRAIGFDTQYRQHQFSQELQASVTSGSLDLIAGAYYFTEKGGETSLSGQFNFIGDLLGAPTRYTIDPSDFKSTTRALYAQANYHVTDALRFTAGYRHTWDTRSLVRYTRVQSEGGPVTCSAIPGAPLDKCFLPYSAKFNYPAWTVGLDYKASDDVFVYLKSSSASLAGGFNTRPAPPGRQAIEPEKVTDIEAGIKLSTLDRRLQANLAVFHSWGKDVQRTSTVQVGPNYFTITNNAGSTRSYGAEFDMTVAPWQGMEVNAGAAYLHSQYKKGSFLEDAVDPTDPAKSVKIDRSGEPIPLSPEWQFNIGATQSIELPIGILKLHADYQWVDKKFINTKTARPGAGPEELELVALFNKYGQVPSYGVLNGRIALELNNHLELSVFGRNLAAKKYLTYVFDAYDVGFATGSPGLPRTYGVGVGFKF